MDQNLEHQQDTDQHIPKTLKEFFKYYWRYDPKKWKLFLFQDFIHFIRYQIAFVFVGLTIDSLVGATERTGVPAEAWWYAFAIFMVLGIGESMHVWTGYQIRTWKPKLRAAIRKDFFSYALGHSHSYYQDNFAGSIARKVTEIAESSWRLHDVLRWNIFGALMTMLSAIIAMFVVSPLYAWILIVFLASVTVPVYFRLKKISSRARDFSDSRASVTGTIVDILGNIVAMRNFSRQSFEGEIHQNVTAREQKSDSKRILTLIQLDTFRRLSFVVLGGSMMVALLFGWQAGFVTLGQMGAIMGQSFALVGAVWMFGFGIIQTADELGTIQDALKLLTVDHDVKDAPNAKALQVKSADLVFRHVDFSYDEQPVFKDLDLEIPAGQKVGLIGYSGAGKSTLVSVLLRLFDIQDGEILIDGQNIANVTQHSLRENISVIPQDTTLFHRSLAENIRYGNLDASDEQVKIAAAKAYVDEFIRTMPSGYNTTVGERGIKLSGGQRQRIAIARAFLKDSPVLILDEATSALDSESEQLIQQSFAELMKGKTVIAIAHRLSTIAHMDRLLVMDQGRVIEDGTHSDLLKRGGLYAKLWGMQSNGFLVEEDAA